MCQWKVRPSHSASHVISRLPETAPLVVGSKNRYKVRWPRSKSVQSEPRFCLEYVGKKLQEALIELEDMIFEAPSLGPRCRAEIHDTVALMVEALKALEQARNALGQGHQIKQPSLADWIMMPATRA